MYQNLFQARASGPFKRCLLSLISSSSSLLANPMPERGRGYKTTPASAIMCLSQIRMDIFRGARPFFTLQVSDIQWRSFDLFHPTQVSPLPPTKLSNDHPLGEALAMWPNKYHWFKRGFIARRTLTLNRIWWSNCSPYLKFGTQFFEKCIKASTEKLHFQQQQIILIFFIFIVSNLVFICFRGSTYNFRLWHLVLDYITELF